MKNQTAVDVEGAAHRMQRDFLATDPVDSWLRSRRGRFENEVSNSFGILVEKHRLHKLLKFATDLIISEYKGARAV